MSGLCTAAVTAALATLALAPAAYAAAPGSSCAHPSFWHLSAVDAAKVAHPSGQVTLTHGAVKLNSDGEDPYAVGPFVTVTGSGHTRVCSVRGLYASHGSFAFTGTIGSTAHPSFARRHFASSGRYMARSIVVAYAGRTRADGRSCDNPAVAYIALGEDGANGDLGATLRIRVDFAAGDLQRKVAVWQTAAHSHTCTVNGWDEYGRAFTLRAPTDGSYAMTGYADVPNHVTTLYYLWIEFTR